MENTDKHRTCARCQQSKPMTKDYYEVVKTFRSGFSYYCNDCSVEMKKTKAPPK
jgi:hypothetical protein